MRFVLMIFDSNFKGSMVLDSLVIVVGAILIFENLVVSIVFVSVEVDPESDVEPVSLVSVVELVFIDSESSKILIWAKEIFNEI
jgi:hypothetical protein